MEVLKFNPAGRLTLAAHEVIIGDRLQVFHDGAWRPGTVGQSPEWQTLYIQFDGALHLGGRLWLWASMPARLMSSK